MLDWGDPELHRTRYYWAAGLNTAHWLPALCGWGAAAWLVVAGAASAFPPTTNAFYTAATVTMLGSLAWSGMWILVLPLMPRFRRMVDSRLAARYADSYPYQLSLFEERAKPSPALIPYVRSITQLRNRARDIMLRRFGKNDPFAQDNLVKFDKLAVSYLQLLGTLADYDEYLTLVDPGTLEADIAAAQAALAAAPDELRQMRERQLLLLQNRLTRYRKVEDKIGVLREEAASIETTMKLLVDQAMTTPDSHYVWSDIDTVLDNIKESELLSQDLKVFDDLEHSLDAQRGRVGSK